VARLELATSKFSNHEGVYCHGIDVQRGYERRITAPQLVYPDGGIHQNHED